MNYLLFVQYSAENLQFYLWFLDYEKRWKAVAKNKQDLSPEWGPTLCASESECTSPALKPAVKESPWNSPLDNGSDPKCGILSRLPRSPSKVFFGASNDKTGNPFYTPASSQSSLKGNGFIVSVDHLPWSTPGAPIRVCPNSTIEMAPGTPDTTQPFREEISRITALYFTTGSSRELNVTARERDQVLHALAHTTHPSAFAQVKPTVEWHLRFQSHPNFIKWSICNGSKARVIFARILGISCMLGGLAVALCTILSSKPRGWRAFSGLAWFLGISLLLAAWNGICPILQGFHHRHLRPWELWEDVGSETALDEWKTLDQPGGHSNSHEDRPWQPKYAKRNVIRKVFEKEVWVEEPALRKVQDLLFYQSFGSGFVLGAILCGIVMAIPK